MEFDNRIYLRDALKQTSLYNTNKKGINAELSAYEYGINIFLTECERVIKNCFVLFAEKENLIKRASLFRKYVNIDDIEALRNQLSEKLKKRGSNYSDMLHRLDAAGIKGEIKEELNKITITIEEIKGTSRENAEKEISKYFPFFIKLIFN